MIWSCATSCSTNKMDKRMKRCKVCGTEYECCVSCEKKHSWRALTDTSDHYYIFSVVMEYLSGHDRKKAMRDLRKIGFRVQDAECFLPGMRTALYEIFGKKPEVEQEELVMPEEIPVEVMTDI